MTLDSVKRILIAVSFTTFLAFGACNVVPATGDGGGSVDNGAGDGGGDGTGTVDGTGDEPTGAKLVAFQDPDSDFTTSDVHDVDNEVVQFEEDTRSLVWAADGTTYQPGTWTADGNLLGAASFFQVRFGNFEGQRRAYFTETATATICDLAAASGQLTISATNVLVPQ